MSSAPHEHTHHTTQHAHSENQVSKVFILTTVTMVLEIAAGALFGSMALLADGWHMFTHSAAFAITLFAYAYARKHQNNPEFTFGTGKVTSLGGFASAVALGVVALFMVMESVERLFVPHDIHFNEAIIVAIIGLAVNVASVFLLHDHTHTHHHHHDHKHHHGQDHNLKAAYFHVLADTLTSILAIIALVAGKHLGWIWLDALMGIVGAVVISKWSYNLLKESSSTLLDRSPGQQLTDDVRARLEQHSGCAVIDIRLWQVNADKNAAIISLTSDTETNPLHYKNLLDSFEFAHITIEIVPPEPQATHH